MGSKHEFALYVPFIREMAPKINQSLIISDQHMNVRINSILRMRPGEHCILFDEMIHMRCELIEITKKNIQFKVLSKENNNILRPKITFALPILKKEDFESALYALVELGASAVQFLTTQKMQRSLYGEKEFERCKRIMISAAEQSKNFTMPELFLPLSLPDYLKQIAQSQAPKIYFDVDGQSILKLAQDLHVQKPSELILMVGPEGDLTPEEKQLMLHEDFKFCALTPTVLRSITALEIGLGIFRAGLR